jgi:hypothetical protein
MSKRSYMKRLNERITDVAVHLQSLSAPEFYPDVKDAADKKDKNALIKVCRKAKIPKIYVGTVVSVILSVSPEQKWPASF